MAWNILFLPTARMEAIEARDWYQERSSGLGEAFFQEMDRQVERIAENPAGFPVLFADVRRTRLRRFPYSLFYRIVGEECFVIACFHASRDPKQWQRRV